MELWNDVVNVRSFMFRYYIDRWNDVVNLNLNVGMRAVGLLERLLSFETVSF